MKTSTTTIHGDFELSLPDRKLSLRPWNPDIWDRNIQLDIAMAKKNSLGNLNRQSSTTQNLTVTLNVPKQHNDPKTYFFRYFYRKNIFNHRVFIFYPQTQTTILQFEVIINVLLSNKFFFIKGTFITWPVYIYCIKEHMILD